MVATSASRDADNADTFIDGVVARLGAVPEVISGHEEAALSFAGAASCAGHRGTVAVVDIGGGSTEFVVGEVAVGASISENVGCVRMTERHLRSDPPARGDRRSHRRHRRGGPACEGRDRVRHRRPHRGSRRVRSRPWRRWRWVCQYDSAVIHGSRISADQVHAVTAAMLSATRAQSRGARHASRRVDVIGGEPWCGPDPHSGGFDEVIVSEHDILDGIALGLARRAQ